MIGGFRGQKTAEAALKFRSRAPSMLHDRDLLHLFCVSHEWRHL
jgi:hypothetical protein